MAIAENQVRFEDGKNDLGDIIYPPIYYATKDSEERSPSADNCSYDISGFIDDVIEQHLYSKDSVQPAYTAGLFFFFQNAQARSIDSKNNSRIRLDFDGNIKQMSPRVSMPVESVYITLGGCVVILMVELYVLFWPDIKKNSSPSLHLLGM